MVLADGRVLNLMSELHKDNSGYDLKDLFIGAEGTLGIITAAVMKLVPKTRAHATATLAARSLPDALTLLNRLQEATGGLVEAFEYMPRSYMDRMAELRPDLGQPFATIHDMTILVELGATAPRDAHPAPDGSLPLVTLLESTLAGMMEDGTVIDAVIAQTEAQRRADVDTARICRRTDAGPSPQPRYRRGRAAECRGQLHDRRPCAGRNPRSGGAQPDRRASGRRQPALHGLPDPR